VAVPSDPGDGAEVIRQLWGRADDDLFLLSSPMEFEGTSFVHYWNGRTWRQILQKDDVLTWIAGNEDGAVFVGGFDSLMRFDGTSWQDIARPKGDLRFGRGAVFGEVVYLTGLAEGSWDHVVFVGAGDGWETLGYADFDAFSPHVTANGDVYVSGFGYNAVSGLARLVNGELRPFVGVPSGCRDFAELAGDLVVDCGEIFRRTGDGWSRELEFPGFDVGRLGFGPHGKIVVGGGDEDLSVFGYLARERNGRFVRDSAAIVGAVTDFWRSPHGTVWVAGRLGLGHLQPTYAFGGSSSQYHALRLDDDELILAQRDRIYAGPVERHGSLEHIRVPGFEARAFWKRDGIAFAVGSAGEVRHRLEGGAEWTEVDSPTDQHLNALWGDSGGVYAVGDSGTILHYDGTAWSRQASGSDAELLDVWGDDEGRVFAVGRNGTILEKRGAAWISVGMKTDRDLRAVWTGGDDVVVVGEGGAIWRLDGRDGGRRSEGAGGAQDLSAIAGTGPHDLFAVGDAGTMLHWDGESWAPVNLKRRFRAEPRLFAVDVTEETVAVLGEEFKAFVSRTPRPSR